MPHVVAVEYERVPALLMQRFLNRMRHRGLARAGQPGKPEHHGFVTVLLLSSGAGHRGVMPYRVGTLSNRGIVRHGFTHTNSARLVARFLHLKRVRASPKFRSSQATIRSRDSS